MAPDFEYFLRMRIVSLIGHSIHGLFIFDLPLSIILLFVFYNIVSKDIINNLPNYFRSRLLFITKINWNDYFKKSWWIVVYSILIGAVTHILWDAFTHKGGFFVLKSELFSNHILVFSHSIGIYKILQHGSTLFAGLFILLSIARLKPDTNLAQNKVSIYWIRLILIAAGISFLRIIIGGFGGIGTFIVSAIAACLYALILTSLFFKNKIA